MLLSSATEVKCGRIKTEEYEKKDYIENKTIAESRIWFKLVLAYRISPEIIPTIGDLPRLTGVAAAKRQSRTRDILCPDSAQSTGT